MVTVACVAVLVVVFAWSSVSKLTPAGFGALRTMLSQLGFGPAASAVGVTVIGAELSVVVLSVYPPTIAVGAAVAAAVMVAMTVGVATILRRGVSVRCACFGKNTAVLNRWHLVRNIALLVISAVAVAAALTVPVTGVEPAGFALALGVGSVLALVLVRIEDVVYLVRI